MPSVLRRLLSLFWLFVAAGSVFAILPSLSLMWVCVSWTGWIFGLGGSLLGIAALLGALAWNQSSRKLWRIASLALAGWMGATAWLARTAPDGRTGEEARVQHRYAGHHGGFRRYVLGNLLPEADQFALGFQLVPAVDTLFTRQQARTVSRLTASIYAELEADPDFHALGSVMPEVYDEIWGRPFDRGHSYLYVPPKLDRTQPQPALLFLHGSGGNFKAYTWLLSQLADELGLVLIAPSYGLGNWHEPDTTRVVQTALDDAAQVVKLDRKNIHLMGLSNGGLGVSQAGRSLGSQLRSLTFISPVLDENAIASREFLKAWRDKPILVISGIQDDRIPIDYLESGVGMMTATGAHVAFEKIDQADHFMLFSHRARVVRTITDWLKVPMR